MQLQSYTAITQPVPTSSGFVVFDAIPNTATNANYPMTIATAELNLVKSGSIKVIPFTAANKNSAGWTYLPSGLLLKWGTGTATRNSRSTITMPNAASDPLYSAIYYIGAFQTFTSGTSSGDINVSIAVGEIAIANPTTFKVFPRANGLPNSGSINIEWYSIGLGPV